MAGYYLKRHGHVNISWKGWVIWSTKRLQHHIFFDGKQHPKNVWFRGF